MIFIAIVTVAAIVAADVAVTVVVSDWGGKSSTRGVCVCECERDVRRTWLWLSGVSD